MMVMSDSLRPARFRIVDHGPRAPDWSPIFFPTASFGDRIGFFARLTRPDGAFWYIVPIATTGIPLARALRNVSSPPRSPANSTFCTPTCTLSEADARVGLALAVATGADEAGACAAGPHAWMIGAIAALLAANAPRRRRSRRVRRESTVARQAIASPGERKREIRSK